MLLQVIKYVNDRCKILFYIFKGVLSLRKKTVKEAMTWLPDVFMVDKDRKTDPELLLEVHKHGFSRIPVYSNEKLVLKFLNQKGIFVFLL